MTFALPSLLRRTNNWGAFVFFAAWCAGAFLYVYLLVPEIAGRSVEEINHIFKGPWLAIGKRSRSQDSPSVLEGQETNQKM
jgi:hypothetical protein